MPDVNKFAKLRSIKFKILPTCGSCLHGNFAPARPWGTCGLHTYQHEKHTGAPRGVSIVRDGSCSEGYERDPEKSYGAHEEFR